MDPKVKGASPFYPGQPVPVELFTGRKAEIERIARAASQVAAGKQQAIFLTGEYGIGKSSLAGYVSHFLEQEYGLFGIHILLGGVKDLDQLSAKTIEAILKTTAYEPTALENLRNGLSKYVGKQELFGFSINLEQIKTDSPQITKGYLPFLKQVLERLDQSKFKGILLILDEINGIASNPDFAHFIKSIIDENALNRKPLPLFLMLCGIEERREQLIQIHPPIERIFEVAEIQPMNNEETRAFFMKAFDSVSIQIDDKALTRISHYSSGYPKLMHLIGEAVFFQDENNVIDITDANNGVFEAAAEFGKRYLEKQVLHALQSEDYHSILKKIFKDRLCYSFYKSGVEQLLSATERKKFNNFLQRMKQLKVLKSGSSRGEYIFINKLIPLYIFLKFAT